MATFYYTVIVQETEPTNPQLGWIWIKESVNQAYMWLGKWVPIAGA